MTVPSLPATGISSAPGSSRARTRPRLPLSHRRERILNRIRECRDGNLSDSRFGVRMRGEGEYAQQIRALFRSAARKLGLDQPLPELNAAAFRRPPRAGDQLALRLD